MTFRNLVVAGAGACLLALTSYAQITAIEGMVKSVNGTPAVGAVVKIVRTDIKGNYVCKADKKGHYFYNGLPLGTYTVSVEVDGKQMDTVNGVRTRLGDPITQDFDLQRVAKENAAKNAAIDAAAAGTGPGLTKDLERGMSKEQKEAYEKALKEREASMKKNKELNDAFTGGLEAMKNKDYPTAITSLTKASELDPKQVAVWANLADAHVSLAGTKTGAEFDAEMAKGIEGYTKALELNPSDAATHNNFALALGKAKKFPEMQAELQKAAELDPPKAGQYYYNLGAMLVNAGQSEPAGEAFKKAIELDPKHADSYYQWGVYLIGKATFAADGKVTAVPGTAEAFQKYLELAPTGQFADSAKGMLASMGEKVSTEYKNPNAPTAKKKK